MQRLIRARKNQKGFTLVELMVVVVIIGVLVAIAIPIFSGIQANARTKACDANIRTIKGAVAMYYAEENAYPADIAALVGKNYLESAPGCPWTDPATAYTLGGTISGITVTCNAAGCPN